MKITVRAKDYQQARFILAKYHNKRPGYIVRRQDSNYFDCYECKELEPNVEEIDYKRVENILNHKWERNVKRN